MPSNFIQIIKPANSVKLSSIVGGPVPQSQTYETQTANQASGTVVPIYDERFPEQYPHVVKVGTQYFVDGRNILMSGDAGGGAGGDADTLDGQLPSYYLDYANFTGNPTNLVNTGTLSGTVAVRSPSGEFTNFVAGSMYTPGNITVNGFTNVTGNSLIGATSAFTHTSRSRVYSAADGRHNLTNAATTGYSRLTLGLENVNCPSFKATTIGSNGSGVALVNGADTFRIDFGVRTLQHSGNYTQEFNNGTVGVNTTVNWRNGNTQAITLSGNPTLTFTAPDGPARLQLVVKQDNTGTRTLTYPGTVKWPAATAPTLTTSGNATDILAFWYDGTNYYGTSALAFG